jgi:hypothetical protein
MAEWRASLKALVTWGQGTTVLVPVITALAITARDTRDHQDSRMVLHLDSRMVLHQDSRMVLHQDSHMVLPQDSRMVLPRDSRMVLPRVLRMVLRQDSRMVLHQDSHMVPPRDSRMVLHPDSHMVLPQDSRMVLHQDSRMVLHQDSHMVLPRVLRMVLHPDSRMVLHQALRTLRRTPATHRPATLRPASRLSISRASQRTWYHAWCARARAILTRGTSLATDRRCTASTRVRRALVEVSCLLQRESATRAQGWGTLTFGASRAPSNRCTRRRTATVAAAGASTSKLQRLEIEVCYNHCTEIVFRFICQSDLHRVLRLAIADIGIKQLSYRYHSVLITCRGLQSKSYLMYPRLTAT